jgi:ABC-type glycerol-3-phosphate transport system substrate-binding protein
LAIPAAAVTAPWVLRHARAQGGDLGAYQNAKINWRQAEGERITVAVIPAGYFDALIGVTPEFEALTGIQVRYEKVPPGQIRQKAILDLTAKSGTYATHAADPMYYHLYASNRWVEPLDGYLGDPKLTDRDWFRADDIIKSWRDANTVDGKLYGVPFDGETTLQIYRKDLYDAKGLKPAETFDELVHNAAALNDPNNRLWGAALRGFAGAGQNMYIYPSIFRASGGNWFANGQIKVNGAEAVAALEWYVGLLTKYAPPAVRTWNWPDLADAFSQGTLGLYVDANTSASVLNNAERSRVIGKIGYARWPKGSAGRRVTSIWNWGFPINAALPEKAKRATWLFIAWAASAETQARTSWRASGSNKRVGLNRLSLWQTKEFGDLVGGFGANFLPASIESLRDDTDVEWRPRMPQWPAVGETMAVAIQAALVGEKSAKQALDEAQSRIGQILKG